MKTSSVIVVLVVAFGLLWIYEANPGNIFQRGLQGQGV